jgi:hypothetical protein
MNGHYVRVVERNIPIHVVRVCVSCITIPTIIKKVLGPTLRMAEHMQPSMSATRLNLSGLLSDISLILPIPHSLKMGLRIHQEKVWFLT